MLSAGALYAALLAAVHLASFSFPALRPRRGEWGTSAALRVGFAMGLTNFGLWVLAFLFPFALEDARFRAMEAQQLRTEAELARLRSHLEPHFLLDTLNAVAGLVTEDPRAARRLLASLGDLLRDSLRDDREMQTLGEQIDWLRHYAHILEERHAGHLAFRWRVDPEARAALLPRFLLQPLVENAVKHGALGRKNGGTIEVRATVSDARKLVCTVQDDGPGMPDGETPGRVRSPLAAAAARVAIRGAGELPARIFGIGNAIDRGDPHRGEPVMDRALQRWGQLGPARARAREGPRRSLRAGGSRRLRRLRRRRLDGWFSVGRAGWLVLPPPPGYSPLEHRVHDGSLTNEDHWRALLDFEPVAFGLGVRARRAPAPSVGVTVCGRSWSYEQRRGAGRPGAPADRENSAAPVLPNSALTPGLRAVAESAPALISPQEAARRLCVCRATIYNLCKRGVLPHVRIGLSVRLALPDVLAAINRLAGPPPRQ